MGLAFSPYSCGFSPMGRCPMLGYVAPLALWFGQHYFLKTNYPKNLEYQEE